MTNSDDTPIGAPAGAVAHPTVPGPSGRPEAHPGRRARPVST